eukprot:4839956-Prymnesium_polylepis.2
MQNVHAFKCTVGYSLILTGTWCFAWKVQRPRGCVEGRCSRMSNRTRAQIGFVRLGGHAVGITDIT